MSSTAPLLVLLCVFAQACQPEAERRGAQAEGATSAPPLGPVRVSEWVAGLGPAVDTAPEKEAPVAVVRVAPPSVVPAPVANTDVDEASARSTDTDNPTIAIEAELPRTETAESDEAQEAGEAREPAQAPQPAAPGPDRTASSLDEILREVARTPTRDELEQARRLNKSGLNKHRRGELEAAIADYEAALAVAPAHVFSRYNLACALALTERPAETLLHLSVLAHQAEQAEQNRPARERLEAARIDKDFETLRRDPRFRELTLATPVQVTWPADGADVSADREAAQNIHKSLREARWDSQLARAPWRGEMTSPALLVREGADPLDLRAARAIHEELEVSHPGRFGLELDAALPSSGPPLVLIVTVIGERGPNPTEPEPREPIAPGPNEAPAPDDSRPLGEQLEAFLGKRLSSMGHGVVEHLELRATGFFSWERRDAKSRILRQGRWELTADGLALDYSARITEGDPPTLVVKDGQRSKHRVKISGQTLLFEDRAFR